MKVTYYLYYLCFFQVSSCCHNGNVYTNLYSTSVAVGDSAQFYFYGRGTYLYWYIDGINTEDMSCEEIADRGISFSGNFNHNPPYHDCDYQDSYLTMAGNCLNNNSQIHCVILGDELPPVGGNTTSNTAILTVEGDPADISNLQVTQTSANQLLIYWQLSVCSQNYTQSINVATNGITTYSSILDKLALYHLYTPDTPDPCVEYNITISVAIDNITCNDSITTSSYLKGLPLELKNTKQNNGNNELIKFKAVNSSSCPGSLPNTVTLVLLDNQGNQLQSSSAISWDNLTVIGHEEYQMEWSFDLQDNTQYQLMIITHNSIGQSTSDPFVISTFDVTSVQYSMDNTSSELCITCTFTTNTQAKGCLVVLLNTDTTLISGPLRISRNSSNNSTASDCITLSDNGHYILSVYDWEEDGGLSNETAVTTNMMVSGIVPISQTKSSKGITKSFISLSSTTFSGIVPSQLIKSSKGLSSITISEVVTQTHTSSSFVVLTTTTDVLTTNTSLFESSNNLLALIFGLLFGMCFLLLLLVLGINCILILKRKLHYKTNNAVDSDMAVNGLIDVKTNSAYEVVKLSDGYEQDGHAIHEKGAVPISRRVVREMVTIKLKPPNKPLKQQR